MLLITVSGLAEMAKVVTVGDSLSSFSILPHDAHVIEKEPEKGSPLSPTVTTP